VASGGVRHCALVPENAELLSSCGVSAMDTGLLSPEGVDVDAPVMLYVGLLLYKQIATFGTGHRWLLNWRSLWNVVLPHSTQNYTIDALCRMTRCVRSPGDGAQRAEQGSGAGALQATVKATVNHLVTSLLCVGLKDALCSAKLGRAMVTCKCCGG
jgi:hypothetical protein